MRVGRLAFLSAAGALLLAAGLAPAEASTAQSTETHAFVDQFGKTFALVDFPAVSVEADTLTNALMKQFPESFAGVVFSEESGRLTARYGPGADPDAFATAVSSVDGAAAPVDVAAVAYTFAGLQGAEARLERDPSWAGTDAKAVFNVWVNELQGELTIDVAPGTDTERVRAAATDAAAVYVKVRTEKSPPVLAISRRQDVQPYYAGAAMWVASTTNPATATANCTAGFAFIKNGVVFQSTAGHCNDEGDNHWYHGTSRAWVFSADYQSIGVDAALMGGWTDYDPSKDLGGPNVWFGQPINTTNYDPITGANSTGPPLGSAMYAGGANSGRVYGVVVDTSELCAPSGLYYTLLDTTGGGSNNFPYILQGDSGGPVTRWNTSTPATDDHVAVALVGCTNLYDTAWVTSVHRVNIATGGTGDSNGGARVYRQ